MTEAIELYAQIVICAIPYGITFALGNLIVNSFLRMAFGGKVEIGI